MWDWAQAELEGTSKLQEEMAQISMAMIPTIFSIPDTIGGLMEYSYDWMTEEKKILCG